LLKNVGFILINTLFNFWIPVFL